MRRDGKQVIVRRWLRAALALSLFCSWFSGDAHGATYLVRSVREFNNAVKSVAPGDTILLANGVWMDAHLEFAANGAEGDSIVLRAETPGRVFLSGESYLRIAGEYLVVDGLRFIGGYRWSGAVVEFREGGRYAQHCRLTNCSFIDYNPSRKTLDYKWVSLYGAHNRVDHCYFEGKENVGTTLVVWLSSQPNYHRIDHNYFGRRPELGTNGGETIRVGTSDWSLYDSFTLVEYNLFEHCNGEAEIISSKSCGNVYRYNTFVECEGALTLRHGNRNVVEGNFFLGNGNYRAGGVRVTGEDHTIINNYFYGLNGDDYRSALTLMNGIPNSPLNGYFQVKRLLVAFNTFVDCRVPFLLGFHPESGQSLPPEDCVFANNVVYAPDRQVIHLEDQPIRTSWQGNVFFGSRLGIDDTTGIRFQDPRLELATDGLWRPTSDSPVIDAAVGDFPDVTEDMDGQPRGTAKDVGADEVSTAPVLRRPLTPEDVGPNWMHEDHPLFIGLQKVGQGDIVLDPPGQIYERGESVQVEAVAASGWRFDHWEGDLSGSSPQASLVVDADMMIRAVFVEDVPAVYALHVYVFSSGGHVELDPPGGSYPESTLVVLTAVPDPGWEFVSWGGDLQGSQNPDTLLMDSDKTVTATFRRATAVAEGGYTVRKFALGQNYPNPFNATTAIPFVLPSSVRAELEVLDVRGEVVLRQDLGVLGTGEHLVQFQAGGLPSGSYFYRLVAGPYREVRRMTLVR